MNYDEEMLNLYFKEKGYSKEKINELLEENPFNLNYIKWEAQKNNDNKTLAIMLKRNRIIDDSKVIQEILIHPNNSVSYYLPNKSYHKICSVKESVEDLRVNRDLILISGLFENEEEFLKFLTSKKYNYIAGICTRDMRLYEMYYNMLKNVSKEFKYDKIIELENNNQNICILKNYR